MTCLLRLLVALLGWVLVSGVFYYIMTDMGNVTDPSGLTGVLVVAVPIGAIGGLLFLIIGDQFIKRRPKK